LTYAKKMAATPARPAMAMEPVRLDAAPVNVDTGGVVGLVGLVPLLEPVGDPVPELTGTTVVLVTELTGVTVVAVAGEVETGLVRETAVLEAGGQPLTVTVTTDGLEVATTDEDATGVTMTGTVETTEEATGETLLETMTGTVETTEEATGETLLETMTGTVVTEEEATGETLETTMVVVALGTELDGFSVSVTGQTVVEIAMILVTTVVLRAGQLVTVAAQEVTVISWVE